MYKGMIAVTNRHLCRGDFLTQIDWLASTEVDAIILREKDLTEDEYTALAADVLAVCHRHHKKCILHTFISSARLLHCDSIHLPLPLLLQNQTEMLPENVGASVHSVEEALAAQKAGAIYLTAGHIFETDCKKGLPGRGLSFLADVCRAAEIPVYAIGGITPENLPEVLAAGAAGGCMMSLAMHTP